MPDGRVTGTEGVNSSHGITTGHGFTVSSHLVLFRGYDHEGEKSVALVGLNGESISLGNIGFL